MRFPGTWGAGDLPQWTGSSWTQKQLTIAELATAVVVGGAASQLDAITGLSCTLTRGGTYWIEGMLIVAVTAGASIVGFGVGAAANFTRCGLAFTSCWKNDALIHGVQVANVVAGGAGIVGGTRGTSTALACMFSGSITLSAATTLQVLVSKSANTVAINPGSCLLVREL